jgi:hypothetical protein
VPPPDHVDPAPPVFPPPPVPVNVRYELSDAAAAPGEQVTVPFFIQSDAGVQGYSASVDFDEEVLEALEVEQVWQKPEGSNPEYSFAVYQIDNSNDNPGNGGVDEGYLFAAVVFAFLEDITMPVDTHNEALRFHFRVHPDVAVATTGIRFQDGARPVGSANPVMNLITAFGTAISPELADSFIFVNSILHVQPDIAVFVRGDSNGDLTVEMADAVWTLGYLFTGDEPPICYDAADTNDDGRLNISDPVYTLQYLFLAGAQPPPPFPGAGSDETEDGMTCDSVGHLAR